ncbi:alpha-1-antitrypsin-like [Dendropsophus ebraccatus]|uniref:alpha-1-antitrypsin-like n=1 Tax=Dendropsophus ebraccatus TaxID=150705 RepID=UPI00383147D0
MRVLLFLGVATFFTLVFADHKQEKDDHHNVKPQHPHNASFSYHKKVPYNLVFKKCDYDLYRQVALDHPSENIVFSPVSISTALAFLSLGAKAQTHSQIREGLGFNTSKTWEQEIHDGFRHFLDLLNEAVRILRFNSGNAVFISKEHKILQTFLDEAQRFYHSEVFSTDFNNTEEVKNQINSYVEKNTYCRMAELLDSVDQDAIFILINYIYFRGNWQTSFHKKLTKEGDFHINENTTVKVPFIRRTGKYKLTLTKTATVVSIPCKGNVNALFILPKEGKFSEVEQNFNEESIKKWKKSFWMLSVDLILPKFSVSATIDLKETLSKLGVVDVFTDNADLCGITGEAKIKVSKAVHKAVFTVDEKWIKPVALEYSNLPAPFLAKFNRPFMFSFYDNKSGSVLFVGRIVSPQT